MPDPITIGMGALTMGALGLGTALANTWSIHKKANSDEAVAVTNLDAVHEKSTVDTLQLLASQVKDLSTRLDEADKERDRLREERRKAKDENDALRDEINKLRNELATMSLKMAAANLRETELIGKISELTSRLTKYENKES